METTAPDTYSYTFISVTVFGILGNILVLISLFGQRSLLKNNYYFLVAQLAINDLGGLIIYLLDHICARYLINWIEEHVDTHSLLFCLLGHKIYHFFQFAGICMMLIISVLRYRATVHPLKTAITRQQLKVVCRLVYIVSVIAGYGSELPLCFIPQNNRAFGKFLYTYVIILYILAPTIFMGVVYYKIGRALIEQDKHMMRVCSDAITRKHNRDRRKFLVCLSTVLCYAVGYLPLFVLYIWFIAGGHHLPSDHEYIWIHYFGILLHAVCSHSANPIIYGILDKKLLAFWNICRKREQRPEES
jgi:hypothetical protein